jgi:hypothetical protein
LPSRAIEPVVAAVVVQFEFPTAPTKRRFFWVVVDKGEIDLGFVG